VGVVAEALEAAFAAGELPGLLGDYVVELGGEGGEIGGGEGEEGGEGVGVGVEEEIVGVFVGFGPGGVEDGLGFLETGEGSVPFLVIPAQAGTHGYLPASWRTGGVPGSRIKPGMTNERRSADSA
jgi:hypothetical protein